VIKIAFLFYTPLLKALNSGSTNSKSTVITTWLLKRITTIMS